MEEQIFDGRLKIWSVGLKSWWLLLDGYVIC